MANVGRRGFLSAAFGGASALAMGGGALARASQSRRPNIIFILADDMGWGDIGAYNRFSAIPTPNLDR